MLLYTNPPPNTTRIPTANQTYITFAIHLLSYYTISIQYSICTPLLCFLPALYRSMLFYAFVVLLLCYSIPVILFLLFCFFILLCYSIPVILLFYSTLLFYSCYSAFLFYSTILLCYSATTSNPHLNFHLTPTMQPTLHACPNPYTIS
jgi:hypothetical protein